jgi:hypothetical protein
MFVDDNEISNFIVQEGIVVCAEYEQILLDAWRERTAEEARQDVCPCHIIWLPLPL